LKKYLTRILLGLALALFFLGHVTKIYQMPLIGALDAFTYDARLRMTMPGGIDERIVILDLDEKSLTELGRWPWSRDKMAALINQLFDHYKIAILGFDVVFAEPDTSSGLQSLEAIGKTELKNDSAFQAILQNLRGPLDYDQRFADTLRGRPIVLGYYFTGLDEVHKSGALPEPVIQSDAFTGKRIAFTAWSGYGANLPKYQQSAASAGHFSLIPDVDGIARRVPMLVEHEGRYYESLSLAMVRLLLGKPALVPGYPEQGLLSNRRYAGLEWLDLPTERGTVRIPVDEHVASLIPYRGAQGSFAYLSAADALAGRLKPAQLHGKIVLLGTTAPGLMDLRATPVGSVYPGVEIHANLIAGILDASIKQQAPYMLGAEVVLVLLCAILLALCLPVLSPLRASLLTLGVLVAVMVLNFVLWSAGLVLPMAATALLILALYALNMSWGYFVESRSKRQFAALFGHYVPPELVDEMASDPKRYNMDGQSAELTVLFADLCNFTRRSEGLAPKELTRLMNHYFDAMTQVLCKNRGTLDKYIGDAIMAFWGAPVADADHVRNAILTALEMQSALRGLDPVFKERGWPLLQIGIGVNTGTMTVGDMGSTMRKSYTVMGGAVNLAARLEKITRYYGVGVIVGESSKALAKDFVYRELDRVRFKGKDVPVGIFEPLGLQTECNKTVQDELKLWHQTLRAYRMQDWDQAELQLYNLSRMNPDCYLYQLYAKRVTVYRATPPQAAWDSVTIFNA
jgi:adenylate cyclase